MTLTAAVIAVATAIAELFKFAQTAVGQDMARDMLTNFQKDRAKFDEAVDKFVKWVHDRVKEVKA